MFSLLVLSKATLTETLQGKFDCMSTICESFRLDQGINPLKQFLVERNTGFQLALLLSGHQYPTIPQCTATVIYVYLPHYTLLGYGVVCYPLRGKNGALAYSNSDK